MSTKNDSNKSKKAKTSLKPSDISLFQNGEFLLNYRKTSTAEWVGIGFALLMLTFFACFLTPMLYYEMNQIKWLCALIPTIIFVVVLLAVGVVEFFDRKNKPFAINKETILNTFTVPQFFIAGYLFLALISAFASSYDTVWLGNDRYEGFVTTVMYGLIFILISQFGKFKKYYIYALSGSSIFISLLAILQYLGKNPFGLFVQEYTYRNTQFLSTLGNIDVVSGFVALFLPMLLAAYVLYDGKYRYILMLPAYALLLFVQLFIDVDSGKIALIVAVMAAAVILFTEPKKMTRMLELAALSAFVMIWNFAMKVTAANDVISISWSFGGKKILLCLAVIIISAILWAYFTIKQTDFSKRSGSFFALLQKAHSALQNIRITPKQYRIAIAACIAVVCVAAFIYLFNYDGKNATLIAISHVTHGQLDDMAGWGRGFAWKKSVIMIGQHPIFGSGPDSFKWSFMQFYDEWVAVSGRSTIYDAAHNDYLQIAVNTGIPSLLCYLGFLISLCVRGIKRLKKNPLIAIFGLGVLGYSAHIFVAFSVPILAPLFWLSCGLLDKCIRQTNMDGPNLLDPEIAVTE